MQGCLIFLLTCVWFILRDATVSALSTLYLDELCGETVNLAHAQGRSLLLKLNSTHVSSSRRASIWDCHVTLRAPHVSQLMLTVMGLNLPHCSTSFNIYGGSAQVDDALALYICSSLTNNTFVTSGNTGIIVVNSDGWQVDDVEVLVTSFYTSSETCQPSDFLCSNKRCVSGSLRCNGYDNCGDGSDCSPAPAPGISSASDSIASHMTMTISIPIGFFFSFFCVMVYLKYMARKRQIANIQQQQGMVRTHIVTQGAPTTHTPPQPRQLRAAERAPPIHSQPWSTRQMGNQVPAQTPVQPAFFVPQPAQPTIVSQPPTAYPAPPPAYTATPTQKPSAPPPPYEQIPGHVPTNQSWQPQPQEYSLMKSDKS